VEKGIFIKDKFLQMVKVADREMKRKKGQNRKEVCDYEVYTSVVSHK